MQQQELLRNKLAELGALRIQHQRDEVVHFLRTRTNRFVSNDISNREIAKVISEMLYEPAESEKAVKIILGLHQFLNIAPLVIVGLVLTAVGSTASVVKSVRGSQEAREQGINDVTQGQIELDKQMIENRSKMKQDFFNALIQNEMEATEKTRAAIAQERQQTIIYLLIFIAILVTSFSLIINKKI